MHIILVQLSLGFEMVCCKILSIITVMGGGIILDIRLQSITAKIYIQLYSREIPKLDRNLTWGLFKTIDCCSSLTVCWSGLLVVSDLIWGWGGSATSVQKGCCAELVRGGHGKISYMWYGSTTVCFSLMSNINYFIIWWVIKMGKVCGEYQPWELPL